MSTARVVAGQYTVIRPIGRGASAVVYVARGPDGRDVALKMLPARPGLRPDEVDVFRREATQLGDLQHPGVLPYRDAGYDAAGNSLYLAMDLLHGETLRDRLRRTDQAREMALDVLEGALVPLAHAHSRGAVHGDLTPSNVFSMRHREGHKLVRLLDLGLAGLLVRRQLVAPGLSLGSPRFMAPEQLGSAAAVGPTADIWAFGVALYEALTGRQPFDHPTLDSTVRHVCHVPHRPVLEVAPLADEGMAQLVDLCLEKEPRRRPPDGLSLMRLFKTLRTGIASTRGLDRSVRKDTILDAGGASPAPPPEDLDRALRRSPRDPEVHRALLAHYDDAGSRDGVWLTACALVYLRAASKEEARLGHHYRQPGELAHDRGLDAAGWAALLHPDQDPRVDAVWVQLHEAISHVDHREEDERSIQKAERVDFARPSSDLAKIYRSAVGALRPATLPRLFRGRSGDPPRHLATKSPTSVFPRGFEEPLPGGALPFAVGRHIAYFRPSHRVCTLVHEPEALEVTFDAAVGLGLRQAAADEMRQTRQGALAGFLPEEKLGALRNACARLGTSTGRVDLGTWRRAVELSCMRAGLVLGADLEGAAWMLRWSRARRRIPIEDAVDDLLRFWSSGAHVLVRHKLGVALKPS